jgi:anthranilate phosphoribosyltransferase
MGVRTIFNVLGPLTNPAGAPHQVLGVFNRALLQPLAEVLQKLGSKHVLIVHSEDGLDEISIHGPTHVAELKDGKIRTYSVTPEEFGLTRASTESFRVDSVACSLALMQSVLNNEPGPARDIVALNAGAAIYAAGLAPSLKEGVKRASAVIASGAARAKLEALIAFSRQCQ